MTGTALAVVAILGLAAPPAQFRYSRPIEAPAGWVRLVLPDDVLDACRPGLPDLRIQDETGGEIPFAVEQELIADSQRFSIQNLESVDKTETSGIVDRGPSPGFADALTFEVAGTDFLKPVLVQSSDDRSSWADVGKGSIFATDGVRMLTLRLPENDRRYLRFRLDDRNGAPIRPDAVVVRARIGEPEGHSGERTLAIKPLASDTETVSRYSAILPAANLAVTALRFQADDPAFSRPVRVYERILFRDEVFRRLVAEGRLARGPGSGGGDIDLPVAGLAGKSLEIEIENRDSPALSGLRVTALARGRTLRFLVRESARLRMVYGSSGARAPQYDLGRAFEGGSPAAAAEATLGPPLSGDVAALPVAAPPRAPLVGSEQWTSRRPIELPTEAGVAYLDFYDLPRGVSDLRIVDASNRQVPYLVEQGSHEHRRQVELIVSNEGTRTLARIEASSDLRSADAIELSASGPDYFSRDVVVREEEQDPRGVTGSRTLGAARWERHPGEEAPVLRIPIARLSGTRSALQIEIENGDNVPVAIAGASVLISATRIDFVFTPGEHLFLMSGNPQARPPTYDFDMLAGLILASPADAARLNPAAPARPSRPPVARWFWIAITIAVLLLVFQLARTLKKTA